MLSFLCFKYRRSFPNRLRITMNMPRKTPVSNFISCHSLYFQTVWTWYFLSFKCFHFWFSQADSSSSFRCQLKTISLETHPWLHYKKEIPLLVFITILCSFPSQYKLYPYISLLTWLLPINSTMIGNMSFICLYSD